MGCISFWKLKGNYHPITMLPSLDTQDKSKSKNKNSKNGTHKNTD